MNNVYSGEKWIVIIQRKKLIVFIQEEIYSVYSDEDMNSAYSGKKWIKIVLIQGRNE
jgi:hypothetical protein